MLLIILLFVGAYSAIGIKIKLQATTNTNEVYTPGLGYEPNGYIALNYDNDGWAYVYFSHSLEMERLGYTWKIGSQQGVAAISDYGFNVFNVNLRYQKFSLYSGPFIGYVFQRENQSKDQIFNHNNVIAGEDIVEGYDIGLAWKFKLEHELGVEYSLRHTSWIEDYAFGRTFVGIGVYYKYSFK